jgi:hypothetical protein
VPAGLVRAAAELEPADSIRPTVYVTVIELRLV